MAERDLKINGNQFLLHLVESLSHFSSSEMAGNPWANTPSEASQQREIAMRRIAGEEKRWKNERKRERERKERKGEGWALEAKVSEAKRSVSFWKHFLYLKMRYEQEIDPKKEI